MPWPTSSTLTSSLILPEADPRLTTGWSGRRALITGGAGFLGGTLAQLLQTLGAQVRVLDLGTGTLPGVDYQCGSIIDPSAVRRAVDGCHSVFHLAARVRDYGTDADFYGPNVQATQLLLQASAQAAVERFVFMSSLAATDYRLGAEAPAGGLVEAEARRGQAMGAYGRSKRAGENLVRAAHGRAMSTTIVRPGMFPYGPGDRTSFLPMANAMRQRVPLRVGDGCATLNTAYAPELARGLALCGLLPQAGGEIYHLADPESITWDQLYRAMALGLGVDEPPVHWPPSLLLALAAPVERAFRRWAPAAMPPLTEYRAFVSTSPMYVSTAKAERELGFRSRITLADGLAQTLAWYHQVA